MRLSIRTASAAALALILGAAACNDEDLFPPAGTDPVDPLFARYLSFGNSITAGFQSGGINEVTQNQAYPVLLARAMGTTFFTPLMSVPGCPALYTNVFTQTRPLGAPPCALRARQPVPPPYLNNVAVPGAEVIDIYDNLDIASNPNALTVFFLGGLTQLEMAQRVAPTFVSVWIGSNDVLGALTNATNGGDTTRITAVADFQTRYGAVLDSIDELAPQGGILIGVPNVAVIPYASAGANYWAIKNGLVPGAVFPPTMTVDNNCAPSGPLPGIPTGIPGARGDSVLVPFPYGGALLAAAAAGQPRNLSCADNVAQIVVPRELIRLVGAVTAYNAFITAQAAARGWAYFDPNAPLDSLRGIATQIAPFPAFTNAQGQPNPCSANPFGLAFSCDAVHPSAATHRLIANKVREAINAEYGTSIPVVP